MSRVFTSSAVVFVAAVALAASACEPPPRPRYASSEPFARYELALRPLASDPGGAGVLRVARGQERAFFTLGGVAQLAMHGRRACALRAGGAVWCWSAGAVGRSAAPEWERHVRDGLVALAPVPDAIEIAVGRARVCALTQAGAVRCTAPDALLAARAGEDAAAQPPPAASALLAPVAGLGEGVSQVALGDDHACARMRDDTVRCWGANAHGQLGDGTRGDRDAPVAVRGLDRVAEVALGAAHSCARRHDRTVWCWGANARRELGCGAASDPPCEDLEAAPRQVPGLDNVAHLAVGQRHACARRLDGSVWCWGDRDNTAGELGRRDALGGTADPVYAIEEATFVAAGARASCAGFAAGRVRCWGDHGWPPAGDEMRTFERLAGVTDATQVALGEAFTCVRASDDVAQCWAR